MRDDETIQTAGTPSLEDSPYSEESKVESTQPLLTVFGLSSVVGLYVQNSPNLRFKGATRHEVEVDG